MSKMSKKKQLRMQQLAQIESSTIVYSAFNNKRVPPSALVPIIASKLASSTSSKNDTKETKEAREAKDNDTKFNEDEKNEIVVIKFSFMKNKHKHFIFILNIIFFANKR
jgi:hypothetical protein